MAGFRSFVLFASMRTGSNFLEASLNAIPGIHCHGEAFNPAFVGGPKHAELLGISLDAREADPMRLLDRIFANDGLNGFRYFPGHDPRVLKPIIDDRMCAKVLLSRNPLDSYVSLKIARATGQWKLGDVRSRKSSLVRFDLEEFVAYRDSVTSFRASVLGSLQRSGQAAFCLDYDDLRDPDVLQGLVRYLGGEPAAASPSRSILPQNPESVFDKVENPDEMRAALAKLESQGIGHAPNFEPQRGAGVVSYMVANGAPLVFLPMPGGPTEMVGQWLSQLGGGGVQAGMTQGGLKDWMRQSGGHRRFTVLRHPLLRAFAAFEQLFLSGHDRALCERIARLQKISLPVGPAQIKPAFEAFLQFVRANLSGQTGVPVDPSWASQSTLLQGFHQFASIDHLLREDQLSAGLSALCAEIGFSSSQVDATPDPAAKRLAKICDARTELLARQAYARDYLLLGFGPWSRQAA